MAAADLSYWVKVDTSPLPPAETPAAPTAAEAPAASAASSEPASRTN